MFPIDDWWNVEEYFWVSSPHFSGINRFVEKNWSEWRGGTNNKTFRTYRVLVEWRPVSERHSSGRTDSWFCWSDQWGVDNRKIRFEQEWHSNTWNLEPGSLMRRFISVGHLRINNKMITVRALTWDKIRLCQDWSTSDISVGHLRINNKTITVRAITQDKIKLR